MGVKTTQLRLHRYCVLVLFFVSSNAKFSITTTDWKIANENTIGKKRGESIQNV